MDPHSMAEGELTSPLPLSPARRMPPGAQRGQPLQPNRRKLASKRHMTEGRPRAVSRRPFFQQSSYNLDGRLF